MFTQEGDPADLASLIEKYRFFNAIYHLAEQPTREQVVRYAIETFDYTLSVILNPPLYTTLTTQ